MSSNAYSAQVIAMGKGAWRVERLLNGALVSWERHSSKVVAERVAQDWRDYYALYVATGWVTE